MPIPLKLTFGAQAPHIGTSRAWSETLVDDWLADRIGRGFRTFVPRIGDWADVKPSLGSGPLESGVFDRPEPEIPGVLSGPLGRGIAGVLNPIARSDAVSVEMEPERGGGFEPGGPFEDAPATDWSEYRVEEIPGTGQPWIIHEESEMAVDWGQVISGAVDIVQGQRVGGGPSTSFAGMTGPYPAPSGTPRTVTVDTVTGQVKPCRRRRRRRLLTPTDLSDLAALAAVVGKGDALKLAVAKAVRR